MTLEANQAKVNINSTYPDIFTKKKKKKKKKKTILLASYASSHSLASQVQVQVLHSPWLVKTFKIAHGQFELTQLVFIDQIRRLISITSSATTVDDRYSHIYYSNAFTV